MSQLIKVTHSLSCTRLFYHPTQSLGGHTLPTVLHSILLRVQRVQLLIANPVSFPQPVQIYLLQAKAFIIIPSIASCKALQVTMCVFSSILNLDICFVSRLLFMANVSCELCT